MRCAWVQDRLLLYLAGEVSPHESRRLLRHLETCAACSARMEELAETYDKVENALKTEEESPATLEGRVMAAVRDLPDPTPARPFMPRGGWRPQFAGVALSLCLAVTGFFVGSRFGVRPQPVERPAVPTLDLALLGSAHRRILLEKPAEEVPDSDAPQLAKALTPLVRFPVPVVDLRPDGARLIGGSRSTVQGVQVARLRYDWQGARVSLFEMDAAKLAPPSPSQIADRSDLYLVQKRGDDAYVAWSSGRTNCVMVAHNVPMHLLFRLACHACEKQERL